MGADDLLDDCFLARIIHESSGLRLAEAVGYGRAGGAS